MFTVTTGGWLKLSAQLPSSYPLAKDRPCALARARCSLVRSERATVSASEKGVEISKEKKRAVARTCDRLWRKGFSVETIQEIYDTADL
ncbi:hypothetical protein NTE_00262 [Candidatus Nitrososphaera evergladensis SR1]|uniref:Uncharacterized protein n=1 Tax=Candidatus Nitrososphaera evergladensis SR1 TaxID=1459636 RepID=A0A075MSM0_9ARCH|nr:hypothetical protein NTE_00262 [Candidatus Nitrososphaera evergladensis SR1]